MEQIVDILRDWYDNSRVIYAVVTLGSVLLVGLVAAGIGNWLAGRLGISTSLRNDNDGGR